MIRWQTTIRSSLRILHGRMESTLKRFDGSLTLGKTMKISIELNMGGNRMLRNTAPRGSNFYCCLMKEESCRKSPLTVRLSCLASVVSRKDIVGCSSSAVGIRRSPIDCIPTLKWQVPCASFLRWFLASFIAPIPPPHPEHRSFSSSHGNTSRRIES